MANPVVSLITNSVSLPSGTLGAGPAFLPFKVVLSSTTYATASAGITVDVSGILASRNVSTTNAKGYYGAGTSQAGSTLMSVDWTDVLDAAFGTYSGGDSVIPTKTSTYGQFTVRLFNGETETADGAKTGTLIL